MPNCWGKLLTSVYEGALDAAVRCPLCDRAGCVADDRTCPVGQADDTWRRPAMGELISLLAAVSFGITHFVNGLPRVEHLG